MSQSETKQRLMSEMKDCMKSGNKDRLNVVRMLITEVKNAEINDPQVPGRERTEEEVKALIIAYHKNLTKTLAEYPADRQAPLKAELAVVEEFMPRQLSADEVKAEIRAFLGTTPERAFGPLMKMVSPRFSGRADGRAVSDALKAALAEQG